MRRCYKVVRKSNNRLTSAIVYAERAFCREYGIDRLVDMGMVFSKEFYAEKFLNASYACFLELWEAECAYMQPMDYIADPENKTIRRFWNGMPLWNWQTMPAPIDTHVAFDIRLVRRIR